MVVKDNSERNTPLSRFNFFPLQVVSFWDEKKCKWREGEIVTVSDDRGIFGKYYNETGEIETFEIPPENVTDDRISPARSR